MYDSLTWAKPAALGTNKGIAAKLRAVQGRFLRLVASAADETISMHPLVQESVRYWLQHQGEKEASVEHAVKVLAASFPTGEYSNWPVCQNLFPHAQATLRHQGTGVIMRESRGRLQYHVSWFLWLSWQYTGALQHVSKSYHIRAALYGDENTEFLDILELMAAVLQSRGNYEDTETMHRQALAGREKELGENHPDTLTSVNNLAVVLQDQGKYEEAEEMYRRALTGYEEELGVDHPDTFSSVHNLAYLLHARQYFQQAMDLYQCAVAGFNRVLGPDHPTTAAC
ncbi:hypothetical protein PV08_11919 [Exophiala spinifera]|uniref:Uncharacterized protein n=1 Tax=Exophiala spinifera TaxID=91928 RepID=A0A0D2ASW2_9EURO|nr:uncharacterized protein PV08_11919 [Exophiala spinifera]KIW09818.1 hypothetical protein PV08_11919 [Exophiala spinifera]